MRFAVALLVLICSPAIAFGQACVGVPVAGTGVAVTGGMAFADGATGYSGDLFMSAAQVVVSAGYTLETIDDLESNANNFRGAVAVEIPNLPFSACPVAGVGYGRLVDDLGGLLTSDVTISSLTIPVGFGIGANLPVGPVLSFVPYAVPYFFYVRQKASIADESLTESSSEFGGSLGLMLSGPVVFGGPSVSLSTVGESDPTFGVTLGIVAH